MTVRTQVKWRGISRQVICLEQRQSNQKWQTVFKRLFSSIKQAACLCQLWVWKKTIQLKRPRMFTHTHSYAAPTWSILYCVLCNAAHTTVFFLFFTSVTKQPITNYTEAQTWPFSNLLVTSCKEDGGASRNQTNQSTSKVESEWIYWQTQKWGAAEINKCEMLQDNLLSLCFKCQ